ncbi:hypothetical protein D477_004511 [Arthrobacter crystallopoietes BAB-32]|uniref:Uncharacterized protein n=1 Tax=Arthrobacter crystallopoietes BAB-32 TaxID=1246476 RepID=N1V5Y1_9MICC|nr:hypothetical protein [Arthrobacter crystallopoietes]EMY35409.1 hypothetical protein D477_004511 [Arthrobacter crystallopoietes BAB-32]
MTDNLNHPGDAFMSREEETEIETLAVLGHAETTTDQLLEKYGLLLELQKTRPQDVPPGAHNALNEKLQEHVEWMKPYRLVPDEDAPRPS